MVVPKLDRLARSVPVARHIADQLQEKGVKLALGRTMHDPEDPIGRMLFNILASFAEFEADLIRTRTREVMVIARAKCKPRGKQRGKQPKLSQKLSAALPHAHNPRVLHRRPRRGLRCLQTHRLQDAQPPAVPSRRPPMCHVAPKEACHLSPKVTGNGPRLVLVESRSLGF